MQVTGHLPFTSMLSAGRLHGRFHVSSFLLVHQVREPGKVNSGKVTQLWQSTRQAIGCLPYIYC